MIWWKVTKEKDLGAVLDKPMKMSAQCLVVVKKADSMLGMIKGIKNHKAGIVIWGPPKDVWYNHIRNTGRSSISSDKGYGQTGHGTF